MLLDELGINITSYTAPTPTEAIALARKLASEDARVVITGSMYLAGEALAEWPHSTPLHPARG
jgi:folylpolyglutamate synthase/dihydropteroate synthase